MGQWPIRFRLKDYSPVALEGEGSLCFSISQLVGQKDYNKANKCNLKKYLFGRKKRKKGSRVIVAILLLEDQWLSPLKCKIWMSPLVG